MSTALTAWLRHPLPRRALLFSWASSFAVGWLLAAPVGNQVAEALKDQPRGDAGLFEPGGALLLDVLSRDQAALEAALYATFDLLVVAFPIWLLASTTLFFALTLKDRSDVGFAETLRLAFARTPQFALLWLVTRLAQALSIALPVLTASTTLGAMDYLIDERLEGLLNAAAAGLGVVLALACQFQAALVAAALARGERLIASVQQAYREFRARPLRFLRWLGYAALALAAHAIGAFWLGQVRGAPSPWLAALVHQVAMLASLAAQASGWMLAVEGMRVRSDLVHLSVATSSTLPAEVEPHDASP